jgi:Protein of unknown function (DUF742)
LAEGDDRASIVRPYARTGGRTRSSLELPLEALVLTTPIGMERERHSQPEHRDIAALCQEVRSVAEVAAMLSVPLGVARVLIADMADLGLVSVHSTSAQADGAPDLDLLERVLSGLRQL